MTIKEFLNQITELIESGRLHPDMEVFSFDGNEYYEIKNYCIGTEKHNSMTDTDIALVIDTDF